MKEKKMCERLKKLMMIHPGQDLPEWAIRHLEICEECRWNHSLDIQLKTFASSCSQPHITMKLDEDRDYAVRNAIVQASQRIQKQKKKSLAPGFVLRPLGIALMGLVLWIGFMSWPRLADLPLWDHQASQRLAVLLEEETVEVQTMEARSTNQVETLRFVGKVLTSLESQKLFWSTDSTEIQRSKWIWLRFLSEKSNHPPAYISELLDTLGDIKALRKLKLPIRKTIQQFEEYYGPFRKDSKRASFEVDAFVISINWRELKIKLDLIDDDIHVDPLLMNNLYPGRQLRFEIREEGNELYIISLSEGHIPSTIFEGNLTEVHTDYVRISGCSAPIHITQRTSYDSLSPGNLLPSSEEIYWVRAILVEDQFFALSISRKGPSTVQVLTGTPSHWHTYGFVLEEYPLNCYFENVPTVYPDSFRWADLRKRNPLITVEGVQHADQFLVRAVYVQENPLEPPPQEDYYYASATRDIPAEEKAPAVYAVRPSRELKDQPDPAPLSLHSDYVVGVTDQILHLASGRSVKYTRRLVVPGSMIQWKGDLSEDNPSLLVVVGNEGKVHTTYRIQSKLQNRVYVLQVEDSHRPLLLYSKQDIPEKGMIQAHTIRYEQFEVALESRCFTIPEMLTFQGTIVKTLNQGTWFVMDNNMMFMVDALSFIQGGPLMPGNTVLVKGIFTEQVFKAYVVEVAKDLLVFTGIIVDIDHQAQTIQLDSGMVFQLSPRALQAIADRPMTIGTAVIIKAHRESTRLIAEEIFDARDYVSDKGVST